MLLTVRTAAGSDTRIGPHFRGWSVISSPAFKGLAPGRMPCAGKGANFDARQFRHLAKPGKLPCPRSRTSD